MRNILLPAAALAIFAAPLAAEAQQMPAEPSPRIMVSATGEAALSPDMAILSLTVLREADTAREALDANSAAMQEVIVAMKEAGIDAKDLQTSGFSIQPRYVYPKSSSSGREKPEIVAYQVVNSLTVRVRDIAKVGAVLDTSVTLGVNQGGNITFTNADTDGALDQARQNAVKAAIARAKTLTGAAGVGLGRILEISEHSNQPRPVPMGRMAMEAKASADVPVEAGENTYTVTVNMTFALDQ